MALSQGLFRSQDQQEQDLTEGPGWTIDEQKPTLFGGIATAIPRGIGQGVADGISMLAHGLHSTLTLDAETNPFSYLLKANAPIEEKIIPGFKQAEKIPAALEETERSTRNVAADLVGDPRTTGVAANVVQGFAKAATEFTAGSLAGGPAGGAALLGATDGYAHYADLLDQGVDQETAARSGALTAMTSAGSAYLPMSMPARWLAGLSRPAALLVQAGAGAAINTSFGAASRYSSAKILDDAGYHEQAEQQKPWDETNLLTDAISGLFFGAHAGWHGIKGVEAANVDPSIRDAAKVVQDRQEVLDRAPGVPVDMASAAVHRASLETALGDLMTDKPVDLSGINVEGATFARPEIDESAAADIIREEFEKADVAGAAGDFDRWLAGEEPASAPTQTDTAANVSQNTANRLADPAIAEELQRMGEQAGWDTVGGRMIRKEVNGGRGNEFEISRTPWIPKEPWFADLSNKLGKSDRSYADVIADAIAGKKLKAKERRTVEEMSEMAEQHVHGERDENALGDEAHAVALDSEAQGFETEEARAEYEKFLKERADAEESEIDAIARREAGGSEGTGRGAPEDTKAETALAPGEAAKEGGGAGPEKAPLSTDIANRAIADRPSLQITDENGLPQAADSTHLDALNAEARANAEADPMHEAAVACEGRHA